MYPMCILFQTELYLYILFACRNVYMDKIRDQMLSSNLMEEDHDSSIFEDIKLRQQLKLAHSCQEQNNFNLTLRILKETYSVRVH